MSESNGSDDDVDVDTGPVPPPQARPPQGEGGADDTAEPPVRRRKKRRILRNEEAYLDALPSADQYQKSYMHRDVVTHVLITPRTDMVVTGSADGQLKIWKKVADSIEFVKQFRAHTGSFAGLATSSDGLWLGTTSAGDKTMKIFDVVGFDMVWSRPPARPPAVRASAWDAR